MFLSSLFLPWVCLQAQNTRVETRSTAARLAAVMARGGATMGISSSGLVREKYCRACLPLDRPQPTF